MQGWRRECAEPPGRNMPAVAEDVTAWHGSPPDQCRTPAATPRTLPHRRRPAMPTRRAFARPGLLLAVAAALGVVAFLSGRPERGIPRSGLTLRQRPAAEYTLTDLGPIV